MRDLIEHGIETRHIQGLIPVSRASASSWLNGRVQPRKPELREAYERLRMALRAAVRVNDLPAPKEFTGRARDKYIVMTLKRHMEALAVA